MSLLPCFMKSWAKTKTVPKGSLKGKKVAKTSLQTSPLPAGALMMTFGGWSGFVSYLIGLVVAGIVWIFARAGAE